DRHGAVQDLDQRQIQTIASRAAHLAGLKGHPVAIARAMIEPDSVVVEATDTKTGAPCFVLESQMKAEPGRYLNPEVRKQAGQVLSVTAEEAETYGLGQVVADLEDFKALYGFRGKTIRVDGPTWVHSLVTIL